MKERPIIFSTESVKAILDGTKTQTRRVIKPLPVGRLAPIQQWIDDKPQPTDSYYDYQPRKIYQCPYGQVGDRLWIKHRYDLFDVYYKPIEGFEGFYSAGTDGHIYRVDKGKPTILQEDPTGDKGYLAVTLSKPGYSHTSFVHRLIAKTFYGSPPVELYQYQTRHLDGNNQNNHPSNLDWGTQEDNWADRKYHGRGMGEQHHNSKLTKAQVIIIRQSPLSQRQLANIYRVSQATIQAVLSNKFWQEGIKQPLRNYPEWHGWQSPLFCPHWASRILLEITEIRVERLQEITVADALDEGIPNGVPWIEFSKLWNSLNAKRGYGWETNPWVWVISFKRLK